MSNLGGVRKSVQRQASEGADSPDSPGLLSRTGREVLGVGSRWADSVGQASKSWSDVNKKDPRTGKPPSTGVKAARVLRATQQSVGAVMSGIGIAKDMLDVGFANLTAPLAALVPGMPAATVASMYIGTPHCHPTHPPSGPPPIPPTPLPSFGPVTLGMSVKVLINGMPAARADDIGLAPTCCGLPPAWFKIMTGSSSVFIGGSRAARMTDICEACNNIKAASVMSKAAKVMQGAGIVAGGLGMAADIAEAAVEDDAAMAAAKSLSAAMAGAQMAADAAKMAVEATMWKDPTMPPTGSMGTIIDPSHATVLIGGFPVPNFPDPAHALLKRLKNYRARKKDGDGETTGAC